MGMQGREAVIERGKGGLKRMHDVIVVGAGSIGSYTAYRLADAGFDTVVVEKNLPSQFLPICSGVIGVEAFERFKLPDESIISSIQDMLFFSPSGLVIPFSPRCVQAYVVDRVKFDEGIRQCALEKGATFRYGITCRGIESKKSHVEVKISENDEPIKGKVVVVASGFNPWLIKHLGLGDGLDYSEGAQVEVKMEGLKAAEVYLGNNVAPSSFGWAIGLRDGIARVGLVTKETLLCF